MKVKLVSITKPLVEGLNSAEELVAYCARVSNPSNQLNNETAPKLLRYLVKNKHWSPYEMVSACFEIVTSRAIAAQILRHRSFSFQEFSQRYAVATQLEDIQWRLQGKTNRQVGDTETVLSDELKNKVDLALKSASDAYEGLVADGVAKECARMVLPLTTQTTLYMNGTLRSWIHYLDLRTSEHTQKEHREIAIEIQKVLFKEFPNVAESLMKISDTY